MNEGRIYVNEGGLRVRSTVGGLPPGCYWEDEGPDDDDDKDDELPGRDDFIKYDRDGSEMAEIKSQLAQLLAAQSGPSRARLAAQRVAPLLQRFVQGAPCLTVWAGMIGTFFYQAYRGIDPESLANVVDVPEEFPLRLVAALGETAIFLVWTCCFRNTIQSAIRREFDASK